MVQAADNHPDTLLEILNGAVNKLAQMKKPAQEVYMQ